MLLNTILILEGEIIVGSPGDLSALDLLDESVNVLLLDPADQSGVLLELCVEVYHGR